MVRICSNHISAFARLILCAALSCALVPFAAFGSAWADAPSREEPETTASLGAAVATFDSAAIPSFELGFTTSSGEVIRFSPQTAEGKDCFFLPAGVSLADVVFDYRTDGPALGILDKDSGSWQAVAPGQKVDLSQMLESVSDAEYALTLGVAEGGSFGGEKRYSVMQSEHIASVFLASDDPVNQGRDYIDGSPDHSTKAPGSISVLSSDSSMRYSGVFTAVKGRGNSSWSHSGKKSYQVKLASKADLLEAASHAGNTEKSKKWLLIGNPFDPTLIRNETTYQLAKDIGMPTAIDAEAVDLYYDGEYRGSYLLTEKAEIGAGRVDIHDLEGDIEDANPGVDLESLPVRAGTTPTGEPMQYVEGVADPQDYTGGYLLELDAVFYNEERSWFKTSTGFHHRFVSKSPESLSKNQMDYVSALVDEAFVCLMNKGYNPYTGKGVFDYFDQESLVKYFFLQEFSKNADMFFSSTYIYIPKGQRKIYFGPLWDCDSTFGIRCDLPRFKNAQSWYGRNGFGNLIENSEFRQALCAYYGSSMRDAAYNFAFGGADSPGSIAYYAAKDDRSRQMNAKLWGVATPLYTMTAYGSYDAALSDLRSWAQARFQWIDQEIKGFAGGQVMYRLYNPYTGEHFYTADLKERYDVVRAGWNYEGVGWIAPQTSSIPVYRLYNPYAGDHHYTVDASERDHLISVGWNDEGIGWYSDSGAAVPLLRQYNPYARTGCHNFTTSASERDDIVSVGWRDEGIGWYGIGYPPVIDEI